MNLPHQHVILRPYNGVNPVKYFTLTLLIFQFAALMVLMVQIVQVLINVNITLYVTED